MNKKQQKEEYYKIYGGKNINPNPFPIGSKLRHRNGTEEVELISYKNELMILIPLNEAALYHYDTMNPDIIEFSKKKGYKPNMDNTTQLHYMYADRYIIIN